MRKWLRRIDFKIILIIIVLVLPMNIIFVISVNYLTNETLQNKIQSGKAQTDLYMQTLESRMENTVSYLFRCRYQNQACMTMLKQPQDVYEYNHAKNTFWVEMKKDLPLLNCSDGCFFFMDRKKEWVSYPMEQSTSFIYTFTETDTPVNEGKSNWKIMEWEREQILYGIWTDNSGVLYGAWFRLSDFLKDMRKSLPWESARIEVVDIYAQDFENSTRQTEMLGFSSEAQNIRVNVEVSRSELVAGIEGTKKILSVMAVIYISLIPVLLAILNRILIRPLRTVYRAHKEIQDGNPQFRIALKANSAEYEQVFQSFNKMADSLYRYKIEAYEHELEKQNLELMNLQLQIRPHFLLNTFNLIYTLVQKNEGRAVQEVIIYVSEYFRYLFRNGKKWTLFTGEMELIQKYIQVASIRYQNRVHMECAIDPEIDYIRVPPLLIHNFVENAVKYGIKEKEDLHIFFMAEYDEGMVTITIANDGNEMSQDILKRNQRIFSGEYQPEEENQHLGLYNSYRRLKSVYGERAGISLLEGVEGMTQFVITFPYNLEGGNRDEAFNCK